MNKPPGRTVHGLVRRRKCDALLAIGGGKGTVDCIEKAFLSQKPVFVASAVPSPAARVWAARKSDYMYRSPGDTDQFDDLNVTPDQFYQNMFAVLDKISAAEHPRRVFVVHGRDLHRRDSLAEVLRKLQFEPFILADEGNRSLTIIDNSADDRRHRVCVHTLYAGGLGEPDRNAGSTASSTERSQRASEDRAPRAARRRRRPGRRRVGHPTPTSPRRRRRG
jgi:hypothetical protein